ncbi:hypothetical protein NPIL_105061 [Nephila pilipes]|uniref:Uncharacterized protein n=1 Tax=Nephila pilipes TaxID=299642 RepID=A0A8X6N5E6_NEPPI|nr:hypothetical protein NPIL_105061 [Nephila pilipes]
MFRQSRRTSSRPSGMFLFIRKPAAIPFFEVHRELVVSENGTHSYLLRTYFEVGQLNDLSPFSLNFLLLIGTYLIQFGTCGLLGRPAAERSSLPPPSQTFFWFLPTSSLEPISLSDPIW